MGVATKRIAVIVKEIISLFKQLFSVVTLQASAPLVRKRIKNFQAPYKLHLGCGSNNFSGWINIDADASIKTVDLVWDLTLGLPFPDDSCSLIYSEHVLEHLAVEDGVRLLRECFRVLRPGGVLRIAMPSLDYVLNRGTDENWRDQDWLQWPEFQFIKTRAEMLNIAFRWWGHQWLYDREELHRRLTEVGFSSVRDVEWGVSEIADLSQRETRKDSMLICEATKN